MPEIEEYIDVAAPPSTVFRFCHDISHRPDWDERVQRMELLNSQVVRQGTLINVDAYTGGPVFSWEGEYVEFRFPTKSKVRVIDAALSSPFSTGSETWTFSSVGNTTRFTLVWNYQPRGVLNRIMDRLGRRAAARRAIQHSLLNLKEILEGR